MDNRPDADERLQEAIEACRGSDDMADPALAPLAERLSDDPQLAELHERLQQTDASITEAFCDVPVPEGLDQRILERLAAAEPATVAKPRSRRWFLGVGIGATVTAAGVMLAVMLQPVDPVLTLAQVRQKAIDSFQNDWPNGQWPVQGSVEKPPLEKFPISSGVVLPPRVQWRNVTMFGAPGVAYDMIDRQGHKATLYVVRRATVPGLRSTPPRASDRGTAGCVTAAWHSGGLLYVLVVHGDGRGYESFVPPANLT